MIDNRGVIPPRLGLVVPSLFRQALNRPWPLTVSSRVSVVAGRVAREKMTLEAMVRIYCSGVHRSAELCPECGAFLDYGLARLTSCPFGEDKPTCRNCRVHCYRPGFREQAKEVMVYAGPRMIYRHPALAIRHVLDDRRSPSHAGALPKDPR